MSTRRPDVIVVGAGHNGLVAATLLAGSGHRVLVLESAGHAGGAAVSARPFPGVDARISRYSYLVSLFPQALLRELGVNVELRRRRISSYTPHGDAGVLICDDAARTRDTLARTLGGDGDASADALDRLGGLTAGVAQRVFPTLTEPLRSRADLQRLVADEAAWEALFEAPLSRLLESSFDSDLVRGIVATDALIGTFAALDDPGLVQNRCFLYHVIGNGTGRWDIPVGGMGALSGALADAARRAGVDLRLNAPVTRIQSDGVGVAVDTAGGEVYEARRVLANVAPAVLAELIGDPAPDEAPEGSQLKLNLLLRRLPRLRDPLVSAEEAFAGTFHVNEGYEQLQRAYGQAAAGQIPELPPCEAYCHSLTDPTILGPDLRAAGVHTLTVFGLHMPARLFSRRPRRRARGGGGGHAGLDQRGAGRADRGLPAAHARRRALPGGAHAGRARGRAGHARRPHLPPRPDVAVRRRRGRGRAMGRRDPAGQRVRVRGRRAARRGGERHPRPQRGPGGAASTPINLLG